MRFSVRTTDYQRNRMLNICDEDLVGRKLKDGEIKVSIDRGCYGGRIVGADEARELLQNASIINMAGEETISLSLGLGIGAENGVKKIDGVPFLIVFKM
ncbi:conserved hypothetical protein [Cenarchaeum symbiosum A]|uniref:DUF424 domain-containing protein n=1 Tax=Cenarchaeum symbiosum (strain A) TaxID=414004 RepID=A0RVU5_CENSY|nr:conserved hypothetical protein [Cenarchaeum symbiosum A]